MKHRATMKTNPPEVWPVQVRLGYNLFIKLQHPSWASTLLSRRSGMKFATRARIRPFDGLLEMPMCRIGLGTRLSTSPLGAASFGARGSTAFEVR